MNICSLSTDNGNERKENPPITSETISKMDYLRSVAIFVLCLEALLLVNIPVNAQQKHSTDLWEADKGDYESYRIPSLIVSPDGSLLAFAEGRKEAGDTGDIDLLLKRSSNNGETWTSEQVICNEGKNTCGNPTPVVDRQTGRIWLFLTWNKGEDSESDIIRKKSADTRRPLVIYSDDNGKTWSTPKDLSNCCKNSSWGWYATGPGVGIQIQQGKFKGRLVIPANHSYDEPDSTVFRRYDKYGYGAHVLFSDDHGKTWQMSEPIRPGVNESQVVELSDGRLMMNMRSYNGKYSRAVATSSDGGTTWSEISHDYQLVESQSQASIFGYGRYNNTDLILFSNPAVPIGRTNMTVRASWDDGETWFSSKLIYGGPAAYSSLTKLPNGNIGLFFEAGRKNPYETMRFISFSPDVLLPDISD